MIYNLNYYNMPYIPKYTQLSIATTNGKQVAERDAYNPSMFIFNTYLYYRMDEILFVRDFSNSDQLAESGWASSLPEGHYLYLFKNGSNNPTRIYYRLDDTTTVNHLISIPDDTSGAYQRDLVGLLVTPPDDVNLEVPEIGQFYRLTPSQSNYNLPSLDVGYINYYDVWNVDTNYYTPTDIGNYLVFVQDTGSNLTYKFYLRENQLIDIHKAGQSYLIDAIIIQRIS